MMIAYLLAGFLPFFFFFFACVCGGERLSVPNILNDSSLDFFFCFNQYPTFTTKRFLVRPVLLLAPA